MRPSDYIKQGWCQRTPARDSAGYSCHPCDKRATQWCMWGALEATYGDNRAKIEALCIKLVQLVCPSGIGDWNDRHTKEEVIAGLQSIGE